MNKTLVETIFAASERIKNNRSVDSILQHLISEVGEVAVEVSIEAGTSYKQPGEDGVVGECVDAILCLLDIIHTHSPHLDEIDLTEIAEKKIHKWRLGIAKKKAMKPDGTFDLSLIQKYLYETPEDFRQ